MKLGTVIPYLKNIQQICKLRDTPCVLLTSTLFTENQEILFIKKDRYRLDFNTYFLILLSFFESLKAFVVIMIAILMMSAKLTILGHLKKGILKQRL